MVALIPAHNEQDSILETVKAVYNQDRRPDQIVVVSDNSTDETYRRAKSLCFGRPEITVVQTENNTHKKPGALNWAWNTFCQDADLVVTLDADTILPPNAVGDWEQEFLADDTLGGSSSKFTMPGNNFLVRLQRSEFSRWTDTGLRRGWTSVLAGTGCTIRNSVLKAIALRDDRIGPWHYDSQVEDFELTYRIREFGLHCHISPTVRAYTDGMDNLRSLWNQRMKWQVGTVEDLLHIGVNPLTRVDWWQQAAGLGAAFVRFGWVSMTVLALAFHMFHFYPLWLLPTVVFILNDTRQALRIPHRNKIDVLMAMLLLPQEFFAWMRAAWFITAWYEVGYGKLTGRKKDRWALQYQAEASRIN